jgi:3-deoxy-manno-octulosonate cytidylyltransferase (CMP-KDO synthetase)
MTFDVVIPARYQSERLPGKPLLELAGKPMIQHVYERACQSEAQAVIVATDDDRIRLTVESFGGTCCMTSPDHQSGTDRLQEVSSILGMGKNQILVNVQGDEPLIPAAVINQVAANLANGSAQMATLCEPIDNIDDLFDSNVVKVITDELGKALYFSRAPVPWHRDSFDNAPDRLPGTCQYFRHLGLYAYRVKKLEQLRMLWNGLDIHVDISCESIPPGVDTENDLQRVRRHLT